MPTPENKRSCHSLKNRLIINSQEAALNAIQTYNNPNTTFKSETFIVLMIIAWTYLLHANYKSKKIDYRYYKKTGTRKKFDRTKRGSFKYWELERCLNDINCPLSDDIKNNLKFLIGIRHEIEHQMADKIDDHISAKFQACSINYNETLKSLFGSNKQIQNKIPIALQFSTFTEEQYNQLKNIKSLPKNLTRFISNFESNLTKEELENPQFSYRVNYIRENTNRIGQADVAIKFIDEKSAKGLKIQNVLIKSKEMTKYKPTQIVMLMKAEGFREFSMNVHTKLWQKFDAKDPKKNYGVRLQDGSWYWYDKWIEKVRTELKS